ncbi:MAG: hypothetical protein R3B07_14045 [Polyangiaceae bacterium]
MAAGLLARLDSEGFLTAYALWGLTTAKSHGYAVPTGSVERGFSYLKQHVEDGDDMHGQSSSLETKPFAAFVLADARVKTPTSASACGTQGLSRFASGLLGAALTSKPEGTTLLKSARAGQAAAGRRRRGCPGAEGSGHIFLRERPALDGDQRARAGGRRQARGGGAVGAWRAEPARAGWQLGHQRRTTCGALCADQLRGRNPSDGYGQVTVFLGDKRIGSATLDAAHPTKRFGDLTRERPARPRQVAGAPPGESWRLLRYSALRYVDTDLGKQPEAEHDRP